MTANATLRDVARLAGVSLGTASHALNNRSNVLPETRARVLDAATTLGYASKDATTNGRAHDLAVIGMLTKDTGMPMETNPFFSYVHYGVESECRAHNISLMFANVEVDDSNHPVTWPRMIDDRNVDGLIVVGTFIEDAVDGIKRRLNKPMVLVDSYAPSFAFDSVMIDNAPGVQQAVTHLLDHGHVHIGLIGWNPASPPDVHERRDGYVRALRNRGITTTYIEESKMDRQDGYAATHRLLKRAPKITAIMVANDDTAVGVLNAAQDMGLHVPRELSIIGFDNIDLAAEVKPALTTVHVHKTWLGKLAVQRLVERAKHSDQPQLTVTVATQLVERESVARPKSAQGGGRKKS